MEDHDNYFLKRSEEYEDENENIVPCNRTSREEDSLLVDLVKGYPHLYDKQSRDFKDMKKKNNSWEEIGEILNATASDCQTRWARLREQYSRAKKLQETETRSGSGRTTRLQFPLYEQMSFLFKHVKSRKSITNVYNLTTKESNPIRTSVLTEKFDEFSSSNVSVSRNHVGSTHEYDTINESSTNILKTESPTIEVSRSSSRPSASHSRSNFTFRSHKIDIPVSQINICNQRRPRPINPISAEGTSIVKHSELCNPFHVNIADESILTHVSSPFSSSETSLDSNDEFPALHNPDVLDSDNEIFSSVESSEILKQKGIQPVTYPKIVSPNRKIVSPIQVDRNALSPALSVNSSSSEIPRSAAHLSDSFSSNIPKTFAKKVKRKSAANDEIENSFLRLTSAVSTHLERKDQNTISTEVMDEDDIFSKTVACQLKKIAEPDKTKIKGQIMKILYDL